MEQSTFSFYPNKHITTGEGGMVITDDSLIHSNLLKLRNLCFDPKKRFYHKELGWNLRRPIFRLQWVLDNLKV